MDVFGLHNPGDIYTNFKLYNKLKHELSDLLSESDSYYPLETRLSHANNGSLKFTDAHVLKCILHKYKPISILEVGSFLGFSTRWILESTSSWSPKVTALDPDIRHRVFDNPKKIVEKLNANFLKNNLEIVTCFFGPYDDDIYYDYEYYEPKKSREYVDNIVKKKEIINESWDRKFDFIFIDGYHSYESVMNNFEIAVSLLNRNGCITFHDAITWEGVDVALKEIKFRFGDRAEVNTYGKTYNRVLKLFRRSINDGIGLFRLVT